MKNISAVILIAFISLFVGSCKKVEKDPLDYYPKVKTISAVAQDDGSVIVTGEIIDEGNYVTQYAGFCLDTLPEPKMLSNQLISYFSGNIFTATYTGFDVTKKYYFRSWAANEYGYAYGNILSLDSIEPVPVVAPCSLPANSANYGGSSPNQYFYDVSLPVQGLDTWEVTGLTGSGSYHIKFRQSPVTKIYTTTTFDPPGPGEVRINFSSGFTSGVVSSGASFYVNQVSQGNWTMTLCSSPWPYNSSTTLYMNLNFVCPL